MGFACRAHFKEVFVYVRTMDSLGKKECICKTYLIAFNCIKGKKPEVSCLKYESDAPYTRALEPAAQILLCLLLCADLDPNHIT